MHSTHRYGLPSEAACNVCRHPFQSHGDKWMWWLPHQGTFLVGILGYSAKDKLVFALKCRWVSVEDAEGGIG